MTPLEGAVVQTVVVLITSIVGGPAAADCAMPYSELTTGEELSRIKVLPADGGGDVCGDCVTVAVGTWNGSCDAGKKPEFVEGTEPANITTFVRFMGGGNVGAYEDCSSTKCACADMSFSAATGELSGGTIRIWQTAGGQNCTANAAEILRHEFAHLLGLADPPSGCSCTNIMGDVFGPIDAEVCQQVDANFQTSGEAGTGSGGDDHQCSTPPAT